MNFLMEKVELPLIPVIAELKANGYLIDCDYFIDLKSRLEPEKASILADIRAMAGAGFEPNSYPQRVKLLNKKLGLPVFNITEAGRPSTDNESLESWRGAHPVVGEILKFKEIDKTLNTFCNFPKKVCKDSRLRSEYTQMGRVNGRFSSPDRIQTIPKKDGYGIRNGFVAPPRFKIVAADFDQQELFVLASVSGDKAMLEAIDSGVDLHGLAAKKVFKLDCEPNEVKLLHNKKREQVKAIEFGIIYGRSAKSLAQELSLTLEEAEGLVEAYFKSFPKVKSYIKKTHDFSKKNGCIFDVFGRRRLLSDAQGTKISEFDLLGAALREAQKFPIQAAAATITKLAMIRCHNHIRESHPRIKMVLSLHDEIQFEVPNDEVEHFAAELPALMIDLGIESFGFKVPFKVSVKSGQSWGTMVLRKPANSGVLQ